MDQPAPESCFIQGEEFVQRMVECTPPGGTWSAKMVLNERGAILFPVQLEHRLQAGPGISYLEHHTGNALAAMLAPGRIEIRFHSSFADATVVEIVASLLADERLAFMRGWQVTY